MSTSAIMVPDAKIRESYAGTYVIRFSPDKTSPLAPYIPLGGVLTLGEMTQEGKVPVSMVDPDGQRRLFDDAFFNQVGGLQFTYGASDPANMITVVGSLYFDPEANNGDGYKFLYGFSFIGDPEAAGGWGAEGG